MEKILRKKRIKIGIKWTRNRFRVSNNNIQTLVFGVKLF